MFQFFFKGVAKIKFTFHVLFSYVNPKYLCPLYKSQKTRMQSDTKSLA